MGFLDFYNRHYESLTVLLVLLILAIVGVFLFFFRKIDKKTLKTPWFEIAPDSINSPESEDMGKTRLLLKRQFEYVSNYVDGLSNTFMGLEKEIINDAINVLFGEAKAPKTHMQTCLINASTDELMQSLKNYINALLVINHIGTDKEKIKRYAKSHTCQIVAIVTKHHCDVFCKLSGNICADTSKYWKLIGIQDGKAWAEQHLTNLLIGISELRYSDFDTTNDE